MTIELAQFWLGIAVLLCGVIGGAMRVGYVVAGLIADTKAEFNALLTLKEAELSKKIEDKETAITAKIALNCSEVDGKIGRVYERFDQNKTANDTVYVRKDSCMLIHEGNSRAFAELNRRMESFEKKLDVVMNHLLEHKQA